MPIIDGRPRLDAGKSFVRMFKRILIADHNKIVCRIINVARRNGVETVAIQVDRFTIAYGDSHASRSRHQVSNFC
jgi:biotin carboxylase